MRSFHYLRASKFLINVLVWTAATPLAFFVYYDGRIPARAVPAALVVTAGLLVLKVIATALFGLHRHSWKRVAFRELSPILKAVLGVALVATIPLAWLGGPAGVPRSIALFDAFIALTLLTGIRATARYLHERRLDNGVEIKKRKRVLVVGAGEAGSLVVREMLRHPETGIWPVGFLDDDRQKVGHRIASVPVLGAIADLESVVGKFGIDEVLIAIPSADGKVIREIVNRTLATKTGVKYRIIPGVYELLSGKVSVKRLREVEIEDLLRRPPVALDISAITGYIAGKTVMITGAGGSIGSELVRQICRFRPKALILFGHGENSIYQLERELDRNWPDILYHSVIGAIQNGVRLDYVFRKYRPEVVFHAAAHKHVPLMELNPEEAVFNNIIGSKNLVAAALKYDVSHFVNISTDKAVNPTSVMGASKRMVEYIVQSAANRAKPNQVFVSVRFGNVLGSRGSVIPVFKQQIDAGGPVTVTHPDMVRYFMTIPEAAQLVLQAAGQGHNGEIYILDMGEPVRIYDLAQDLIKLSGLEPGVDIDIEFTGVRPGEKLFEELMTEHEKQRTTAHNKIFVATPAEFSERALEETVDRLTDAALRSNGEAVREALSAFIPNCAFQIAPTAPIPHGIPLE